MIPMFGIWEMVSIPLVTTKVVQQKDLKIKLNLAKVLLLKTYLLKIQEMI